LNVGYNFCNAINETMSGGKYMHWTFVKGVLESII